MSWSSYGLLALLLVVTATIGFFGGHFGYSVNGIPVEAGNTVGLDWGFLFLLLIFSVDGVPAFLSAIFLVMQIMTGFLIVNIVRGAH